MAIIKGLSIVGLLLAILFAFFGFEPFSPENGDTDWTIIPRKIAELINATIEAQISEACRLPEENQRTAYDEPDTVFNATGLISSKGYPVENYDVQTEDGFLLGLVRIPHGKTNSKDKGQKPSVLLQHGILACSTNWVSNLANESLAFILADNGYDVWMGNIRGNTYSKKHKHLTEDQEQFWEWSIDEMAKYDLPAMVDHILNTTGHSQISYIGHSQGTTMAFAGLSISKELQSKLNLFVALAPVVYTSHMTSPLLDFAKPSMYRPLFDALRLIGMYELLPKKEIGDFWANTICSHDHAVVLCRSLIFLFGGFSCQHMNTTRIPVYISNSPAGTSLKNVEHWAQVVYSASIARFDYGDDENIKHYGQNKPPMYQMHDIDIPVALFYGAKDILAQPKDVYKLLSQLKNVIYKKEIETYGHLDFIWAVDSVNYVYKDVLKILGGIYNG
ncbi:gastric triacylglycerol lipase-like [Amphiura filiformis]|uniref:gastric triacylglycerol lipase-like n=1 Tax=Amphiura filiformis TaxID=82378 RepID=UPI003B215B67